MRAFDTAGTADLAAFRSAGAGAVGLYLGGNLTRLAAEQAANIGIGLWSFWEHFASDPNGGAAAGEVDAKDALQLADGVGQPKSAPVYMPNDQIVTDLPATLAYFQRVATIFRTDGRAVGFYGQTSIWDQVKGYGYKYFCHAPDGTPPPYPDAHIVQSVAGQETVEGVTVDVDDVQADDYGGWNASGRVMQTGSDNRPTPNAVHTYMPLVVYGASGIAVEQLQRLLNGHGWQLKVDGDYGPRTQVAVEGFQKRYGITPARHFGVESWTAAGWGRRSPPA